LAVSNAVSILQAVPVLEVADVGASCKWYRETLGFTADPFPEAPPHQFALLRHGPAELMLRCGAPKAAGPPRPYRWDVYLRLTGGRLRHLYADLSRPGVVSRRLERMFYGVAEFEVRDPDGYALCLAEALADAQDLPTPQL
jgi:catechol 2,3-dioxygenase-like lactoylglutathione lyase family enzyme